MGQTARVARALALLGVLACSSALASEEERVIRYADDALTVRLAKVPVSEVLDEVSRLTGAGVRGQVRTPRDVSAEFDHVPLPEALHRLLGDQNFALVYAGGGQLRAIKLLGAADGTAIAATTPPTPPPAQTAPGNLASLVARHSPVPVSGRLSEVVGSSNAGLQQLLELGMRHEDATIRADAVRALVATLEIDPALRTAVIGELNTLDDNALSSMLRSAAGDHAEELAMQILTQARASEIRVKASSVLQKLRAGG